MWIFSVLTNISIQSFVYITHGELLKRYLCIQVVCKAFKKLALDWVLLSEQSQVMAEFVVCCNDDTFSKFVKLRPPSPAKYLHDI